VTTTTGRGIAVTGKSAIFTEDGTRAYAYSGMLAATNGTISSGPTMIQFINGPDPLLIKLSYNDTETSNYTRYLRFLLNDVIVMDYEIGGGSPDVADTIWKLIIPPTTEFKVIANINGVTDTMCILLTGKTV